MIKINKDTKPKILEDNAKRWTDEYLTALKQPTPVPPHIKYRYQHNDIKDALEKETHGKCAYCESKIKHVAFGDIEHILPKNKNACPELYVEWTNLTLACEVCNRTNKKDYYNPSDPLINPIADEPDKYLMAFGPFIYQVPGEKKGELSIAILDLNRSELIERRKEKIENLLPLVDKWKKETNETYKKLLYSQIKKEAESDKEFSFIINGYLKQINFYN